MPCSFLDFWKERIGESLPVPTFMKRRTLIILAIIAVACLVLLIFVFANAKWDEIGNNAEQIWRNTVHSESFLMTCIRPAQSGMQSPVLAES